MPHEVVSVPRPTNNRVPHVIVGAPSTDPFRWILGFEDLSGGGDRDFNDVVFQINKSNGGTVTSGVVSSDISPSVASDFTITNVRFKKDDNVLFQASGPANACAGPPKADIDYFVAVDCNICRDGVCTPNPSPSWTKVPLPATNPAEVTFNVLDLGLHRLAALLAGTALQPQPVLPAHHQQRLGGLPGGARRPLLALQPLHGGQFLRLRHLRDAGSELDRVPGRPPNPAGRSATTTASPTSPSAATSI